MIIGEKQAIATAAAPAAIGPYSQAVCAGGLLYTSGQIGLEPDTGQLVSGGIEAQTRQVFENLKAILEAGGTSLNRVIKTLVFLKSMGDFATMNIVYGQYLAFDGTVAPARSTIEVSRLPKDALVKIEVIALAP